MTFERYEDVAPNGIPTVGVTTTIDGVHHGLALAFRKQVSEKTKAATFKSLEAELRQELSQATGAQVATESRALEPTGAN